MISWHEAKKILPIGTILTVAVLRHKPYGVFVSIPEVEVEGLIRIIEFEDAKSIAPSEYLDIGSKIEAVIIDFQKSTKF